MTYTEQIRHPSGALDPPREKNQNPGRWLWLVLGLVALVVYLAWRAGWFGKMGAIGASAASAIANPHGWM